MKRYKIPGWQSWTPCEPSFLRIPNYFYSPHGIAAWEVPPTEILKKPIKGWCSWYAYGPNISEEKILANTKKLKEIFRKNKNAYVIVDDGWTRRGDWSEFDTKKFPSGMKSLANEIVKLGLKPGIWVAPFWADPKSKLAERKPELFIRHAGKFIEGYPLLPFEVPFLKFMYILDLEKTAVQKYIKSFLKIIIEDWGYELLKLDFLYAIYFNPAYKDSKVPDQLLKEFLKYIKETYPQVYTIGCGCPLGPAAGLIDAMRISADITNPLLNNLWPINKIFNSARIIQLEQNLKSRAGFSKIWNLDPDVFVTSSSTGLSKQQIRKLHELIISSGGLFILGDDLTKTTFDNLGRSKFPGRQGKTF